MKKVFLVLFASILLGATAFSQIPTNGLIGWWPFTGNANDMSGNGNNGTVSGATLTSDRFGNPNSAYQFNGTTNFIEMISGGPTGHNSRTVSFWAKTTSTNQMVAFDYGQAFLSGGTFDLQFNNGCSGLGIDVSDGVVIRGSNAILDNAWHHFVAVLDTAIGYRISDVQFYIDGVLQPSIACWALSQSVLVNTGVQYPVIMGTSAGSHVRYFNGALDDFGFYNRALDSSEVQILFNGGICYQYITVTDTNHVTVTDTNHITVTDTSHITVTDTNYISVSVTDTLIINAELTGINPPDNINTIKIFPNPTATHVTIDNGDYNLMNGYTLKIDNSLGQTVFSSLINQQQFFVNLSTWTGNGTYFVYVIDAQQTIIETKKIVLQ